MGLDSVEILVRVEEHFGISIPDAEAAQISTVQEFADCVFTKVGVHPGEKCKSQMLFNKLRNYLVSSQRINGDLIKPGSRIRDLITNDIRQTWTDIADYLKLDLPALSELDLDPTKEKEIKILGLKFLTRKSPVTGRTIDDLINWVLAKNYIKLIHAKNLFDKADVERVVVGIISDSAGIPVEEIENGHRITSDLGID